MVLSSSLRSLTAGIFGYVFRDLPLESDKRVIHRKPKKSKNGEGLDGLPRFCSKSVKTRRKKLET